MDLPTSTICALAFPTPSILLVTLNQPQKLNCIPNSGHEELSRIWDFLDSNPALAVGILTGEGRAFCGGADLRDESRAATPRAETFMLGATGFCGVSAREGRKPIIAAVDGLCVGGGTEVVVNCDIVVASARASFALPDVKVGLIALGGALPRLVRLLGKQRATMMALTGRTIGAKQARDWGLVCEVVDDPVKTAVEIAKEIAANSPDAIRATVDGLRLGWSGLDAGEAGRKFVEEWWPRVRDGENLSEGINSFLERRRPTWVASKL